MEADNHSFSSKERNWGTQKPLIPCCRPNIAMLQAINHSGDAPRHTTITLQLDRPTVSLSSALSHPLHLFPRFLLLLTSQSRKTSSLPSHHSSMIQSTAISCSVFDLKMRKEEGLGGRRDFTLRKRS